MIKRMGAGWLVDVRPLGVGGPRLRRMFATKREALAFERESVEKAVRREQRQSEDLRRLSDLIAIWYRLHGQTLRDGAARRRLLDAAAVVLGDPVASVLTAAQWASYRSQRLDAGVSPATCNRERSYWRALFAELSRLGEWSGGNPVAAVRPVRVPDPGMRYLSGAEVRRLLEVLREGRNPDTWHVARLCLATGARWGEAERLQRDQVGPDRVTFVRTKSGEARTVPVDPVLLAEWSGRVGVRLFGRCYAAFRHALGRAGIDLPKGQAAHVLRHTFASWFVARGGSLLTLQRILGHSAVEVTMRYAHLVPDHLDEVRRLNPLALLDSGQGVDGPKKTACPIEASR